MSDFYEDDDVPMPEEELPETAVVLKIDGFDVDRFTDAIVAKIARERHKQVEKLLDDRIERKVAAIVDEAASARIADAVERVLRDGFTQTDEYGRAKGQPLTLRSMIIEYFKPTQYRSDPLPRIISEVVRNRFDKEVDDAVKTLRAQVQSVIGERLNKALRDALGVKA